MEKMIVAAVSTQNWIGQPGAALSHMLTWIESGVQQGAELVLFPELNVTGYIQHSIARQFAETIPGPSTEQAIHVMSIVKAC
jgi:predicted amidohydrolase